MQLTEIFPGISDEENREIKGICIDSRKAKEGDLFFCLKGTETDGHRFARAACLAGASAVVHSDPLEKMDGIVYIEAEDVMGELNRACDLFFGHPSRKMKVFGVTGTNGKTTTAGLIEAIYGAKVPCGYIGTVATRYGDVRRPSTLTTPEPVELHSILADMVEKGMKAVSMEVSSHGLVMRRTESVDFDVAIFTNLTYDHLDFHKSMEQYFDAKKMLFSGMKPEGTAVLNADEHRFEDLAECCSCKYVTYGIDKPADYRAENIRLGTKGTEFTLSHGGRKYEVKCRLQALFNVYNLLGAIAAVNVAGMELKEIIPLLDELPPIEGRLERISGVDGDEAHHPEVIVDYAHTPDGYRNIFEYAESVVDGDIYCVFGCPGKRDKHKRPVMGEIARKHCRRIFVTEQDPRDEDPADIARDIIEGAGSDRAEFIGDRRKAIETAIHAAKPGDCVLILGKGEERYLDRKDGKHPWIGDDVVAKAVIEEMDRERAGDGKDDIVS